MKRLSILLSFLLAMIIGVSAGMPKAPSVIYYPGQKFVDYKYFYVTPTPDIESETGVYGTQYGVFTREFGGVSQFFNPGKLIAEILVKHGFTEVTDITPENADKTMIVTFGTTEYQEFVSGQAFSFYNIDSRTNNAQRVAIQFVNAATKQPIVVCASKKRGSSKVEDIRKGIKSALKALFDSGKQK